MSASASPPERVYVGKRASFKEGTRQLIRCGTRNIAVVCHGSALYAIDNACYHHGGPLLSGDIEEMGGHPCIVCPWHSYKIALDTGEGLYLSISMAPGGGAPQQVVRSKGCKQRVHKVEVDAAGDVFVLVDLSGPKWESDAYAAMELANRERPMGQPMESGGGGPRGPGIHSHIGVGVRSGHVFQSIGALGAVSGGGVGGGGGRGGTNPFSREPRTRPPMSAPLPQLVKSPLPTHLSLRHQGGGGSGGGDGSGGSSPTLTTTTKLLVSCNAITELCPGVRQFDFIHHGGPLLRHAKLGEYVELELPIKEIRPVDETHPAPPLLGASMSSAMAATAAVSESMRRRWTICDVNRKGSLFSLIVKCAGGDPQRSGSAWLHQHALHVPLRVARVGGTFTFADHHDAICAAGGQVLWLTAGVGVTAAYAFLNSSLEDSFYMETAEPLDVVHLHVNHSADTVPKLEEFRLWQRRFPRFLPSGPAGAGLQNEERSGRRRKSYAMELFITTQATPNDNVKRGPTVLPRPASPITHHGRLQPQHIAAAVRDYFGAELPLVYVCGPPAFVSDCTDALLSACIPESSILTDDP